MAFVQRICRLTSTNFENHNFRLINQAIEQFFGLKIVLARAQLGLGLGLGIVLGLGLMRTLINLLLLQLRALRRCLEGATTKKTEPPT